MSIILNMLAILLQCYSAEVIVKSFAKSCKIIVNNGDTKNIDINNLNTFAITTHRENSKEPHSGYRVFH